MNLSKTKKHTEKFHKILAMKCFNRGLISLFGNLCNLNENLGHAN